MSQHHRDSSERKVVARGEEAEVAGSDDSAADEILPETAEVLVGPLRPMDHRCTHHPRAHR